MVPVSHLDESEVYHAVGGIDRHASGHCVHAEKRNLNLAAARVGHLDGEASVGVGQHRFLLIAEYGYDGARQGFAGAVGHNPLYCGGGDAEHSQRNYSR